VNFLNAKQAPHMNKYNSGVLPLKTEMIFSSYVAISSSFFVITKLSTTRPNDAKENSNKCFFGAFNRFVSVLFAHFLIYLFTQIVDLKAELIRKQQKTKTSSQSNINTKALYVGQSASVRELLF
jgi:hypothetical protein